MSRKKEVLLLVGSPRGKSSTSAVLGNYILNQLEEDKFNLNVLYINSMLKSQENQNNLIEKINHSKFILLSTPLYVDTLPAPVTKVLELIADNKNNINSEKKRRFIGILNCGFPEENHNHVALSICKQFACETGIKWTGGLSLGMGGAIGGQSLDKLGAMVDNVKKALELVADTIIKDQVVPQKAVDYMAKPFISDKKEFISRANESFKKSADNNNVLSDIDNKPYISTIPPKS